MPPQRAHTRAKPAATVAAGQVGERDVRACLGKHPHDARADCPSCAGDERHAARERRLGAGELRLLEGAQLHVDQVLDGQALEGYSCR
jgi:hypothetical protein